MQIQEFKDHNVDKLSHPIVMRAMRVKREELKSEEPKGATAWLRNRMVKRRIKE